MRIGRYDPHLFVLTFNKPRWTLTFDFWHKIKCERKALYLFDEAMHHVN